VDPGRPLRLVVHPFDHREHDGRGFRIGTPRLTAGQGVRVALIDTGVARDHPDVVVAAGRNCVTGEDPADYGPNGHEHGTHVAGIVGGRGRAPTGSRVAPGAERCEATAFGGATAEGGFAMPKAPARPCRTGVTSSTSARRRRCRPGDQAVGERPRNPGCRGGAAGNDGRAPVAFRPTCPTSSPSPAGPDGDVSRTRAERPSGGALRATADFVAAVLQHRRHRRDRSGVGIVSTVPGGYLDLDGTSMACPFVTGILARTLSGNRRLRASPQPSRPPGCWPSCIGGPGR
jgi:subtilisin